MKIQYCSDLHLEFSLNEKFMNKYPLQVVGDILMLAGDIVPFAVIEKYRYFFDFVSDNFQHTYWIPGNHEYYQSDIAHSSGTVQQQIRDNVSLVNNAAVTHGDVQLIFSTLWSHVDPLDEWAVTRAMSDFHVIRDNGAPFSIRAFNRLHEVGLQFITTALDQQITLPKVVVTHHLPTFLNYPAKYKGDVVSQAFATELSGLIEPSGIHSWIYGHHHTNTPDFKIGDTTLRTNQLGYVKHGEHSLFDRGKFFEVG